MTSGVLKDVVARDLGIGAVTSEIQASVMENTNLFTIRVRDASPETAYRVMKSVITNYPEVAEYIIGATTLTVVDESGVPAVPVNSQDALRARMVQQQDLPRFLPAAVPLCENKKNHPLGG